METVNRSGLFASARDEEAVIETYSGEMFDVLNPNPDQIRIGDIAQALSNACRFSGQCSHFYSVAQHCVHVANEVGIAGHPSTLVLAALLHDGSEAYITDITRPVKLHLKEYQEIEARLQDAVHDAFGIILDDEDYEVIKKHDNAVCKREAMCLMYSRGAGWDWTGVEDIDLEITPWPSYYAKNQFLSFYEDLTTDDDCEEVAA